MQSAAPALLVLSAQSTLVHPASCGVGTLSGMDRDTVDLEPPDAITLLPAFFVARTGEDVLLQRRHSHPVDKCTGGRSLP